MIKVILTQDIKSLGSKGDIKSVSDGYARNFLFSNKLAVKSTEANLKLIEEQKKRQGVKAEKEKDKYVKLAEDIKKLSVTISRQVGEEEKMFGEINLFRSKKSCRV